jgi:hypothetical protein
LHEGEGKKGKKKKEKGRNGEAMREGKRVFVGKLLGREGGEGSEESEN